MPRKTSLGDVEQQLTAKGYYVHAYYVRNQDYTPESCMVTIFQDEGVVAEGVSKCHPNDNFWKKKGRHIAVCRAAKAAGLLN